MQVNIHALLYLYVYSLDLSCVSMSVYHFSDHLTVHLPKQGSTKLLAATKTAVAAEYRQ